MCDGTAQHARLTYKFTGKERDTARTRPLPSRSSRFLLVNSFP